jgi:hypothetical protein
MLLTIIKNMLRDLIESFQISFATSNLRTHDVLKYSVAAVVLYIGAGSAYILGVTLGLPSVIVTSLNHSSITHLLGQASLVGMLALSFFKILYLLTNGLFILLNILICRYYFAQKRPQGWRQPSVARLMRRMNNAIHQGRSYRKSFIMIRWTLTLVFLYFMFFKLENNAIATTPSMILVFLMAIAPGLFFVIGALSDNRDADIKAHGDLLALPKRTKLIVLVALWICMLLGLMRSSAMMHGAEVHYKFGEKVCGLAPMMPIYGGDLYFDRVSYNFVVVADGKITFYIAHQMSQEPPACL